SINCYYPLWHQLYKIRSSDFFPPCYPRPEGRSKTDPPRPVAAECFRWTFPARIIPLNDQLDGCSPNQLPQDAVDDYVPLAERHSHRTTPCDLCSTAPCDRIR